MKLNPKILGSSVAGISLVVLAFVFHKDNPEPSKESALHVSTERKIREFIPITDTDKNEIPDWQEKFAKEEVDLDQLNESGNSFTETQTSKFMYGILESAINNPDDFTKSNLLTDAVTNDLGSVSKDKQFTKSDINISYDNSTLALRDYGNKVAEIVINNAVPKAINSPLDIMYRSLKSSREEDLKELDFFLNSYEGMLLEMTKESVPEILVKEHLSLINVYQAIYSDLNAFNKIFDDALLTMLRIRRYSADIEALNTAISNLYLKLHNAGIEWTDTDTAYYFIEIVENE